MLDLNYINRLKVSDVLRTPYFTEREVAFDHREVALKMVNYYRGGNLVSTIESYLSFTHLPQEERKLYAIPFNAIDLDHNGLITLQEITEFLSSSLP